jgi:FixJ family two-component response regulator
MKFVDIKNDVAYIDADKHNWTKLELDAYDYVLMREQDDRGRVTLAVRKALSKRDEEIAKKLISRKLTNEEIAEDTGLSIEQIEKLRS